MFVEYRLAPLLADGDACNQRLKAGATKASCSTKRQCDMLCLEHRCIDDVVTASGYGARWRMGGKSKGPPERAFACRVNPRSRAYYAFTTYFPRPVCLKRFLSFSSV